MRMVRLMVVVSLSLLLLSCITFSDSERMRVSDFRDFESWFRVTDEPLIGAGNGPLLGRHLEEEGMREVYINEIGRGGFDGGRNLFPKGTVIVKDTHYVSRDGGKGRRWNITVMRKREAGYDPEHNNWEYVTAGPTKFIRVQGTYPLCIECHVFAREQDYVFTWPQ